MLRKLLIIVAINFSLVACSNSAEKNIVGQWEIALIYLNGKYIYYDLNGTSMAFLNDNTCMIPTSRKFKQFTHIYNKWELDSESDVEHKLKFITDNKLFKGESNCKFYYDSLYKDLYLHIYNDSLYLLIRNSWEKFNPENDFINDHTVPFEEFEMYPKGVKTFVFYPNLFVNWNYENNTIKKDDEFKNIKENYNKSIRMGLLDVIMDTTSTYVESCYKSTNLDIGDIAFMALVELEELPYSEILDREFEESTSNCKYPKELFDYINNNKEVVVEKLGNYFPKNRIN